MVNLKNHEKFYPKNLEGTENEIALLKEKARRAKKEFNVLMVLLIILGVIGILILLNYKHLF